MPRRRVHQGDLLRAQAHQHLQLLLPGMRGVPAQGNRHRGATRYLPELRQDLRRMVNAVNVFPHKA